MGDVKVKLPELTVLFGPNAAGKSNLLDAIQALSRLGTSRTVADALAEPIRGYPIEAFSFPDGGLPGLLNEQSAQFSLEADLAMDRDSCRYRVEVAIQPGSGSLSVRDEYLSALDRQGEPKGNPFIEKVEKQIRIRRKSKPAHPRYEPVGSNHTQLSDPRLSGVEYKAIEACRKELLDWRVYYLDPRSAMRSAHPPAEVNDIGVLGGDIAPLLYRMQAEETKRFDAVKRTLRTLIPSVDDISVDLDKRRGTLDILVRQGRNEFSSRIISEGTLRVLALCVIAVNPWCGSLIAFEEPENGVHPRRLELIAELLTALAMEQGRQLIVTTHSPLFCSAIIRLARKKENERRISILNVQRGGAGTEARVMDLVGPLFDDPQLAEGLSARSEDGVFEGLVLRGMLDE